CFLLSFCYEKISLRHMKQEQEEDRVFSRKVLVLGRVPLATPMSHPQLLALLFQDLLRFEDAKTPIAKLKHLRLFIERVTDHLAAQLQGPANADQLLECVAGILWSCPSLRLISSTRFVQRLRRSLDGSDSYKCTLMDASLSWILQLPLPDDCPDDIKAMISIHNTSPARTTQLVHPSLLAEAVQLSKTYWNPPSLSKDSPSGPAGIKDRLQQVVKK
ncbi:hypothetical protein HDU91_004965, partial [Kappamyces sp. JEL0680]